MFARMLSVALLFCLGLPLLAGEPALLKIGIVDSLARDLSAGRRKFVDTEFPKMVKDFTGFKSDVIQGGDLFVVPAKLDKADWHFAVVQGVEMAWLKSKEPKLVPLMVAVYKQPFTHAVLVGKAAGGPAGFADLMGKDVNLLTKEHCRLFANKAAKGKAENLFGKVVRTDNVEAALDDLLLDKASAAIVDNVALDVYKDIHPGRFKRLKMLAQSEPFPPAALVYREGTLSDKLLNAFRTGMLKAHKSEKGREIMADFHITAFENVPADYETSLADIRKAYPAP